jgi:hypothetical protein
MKLTLKDLKQNTHTVENLELTDTVQSLAEKAKQAFNFPDGVKLIYSGKIMEHDKLLADYFKDNSTNSFVVCMPEKPKPAASNTPVTNTLVTNTPVTNTPVPVENTYTDEQIRAFLLVFTQFMRMNPDVFHIFCTNPNQFQSFILGNTFMTTILRPILQTSTQVVNAIQTGQDIHIPIPVVSNITTNTNTNTSSEEESEESEEIETVPENQNLFTTQNEFSAEDNMNIQELVMLGFPENVATQAYLMSGKNKAVAASLLFDI